MQETASRFVHRAMHGLFLLAAVSVFTFFLLSIAPGNSFDALKLDPQISSDTIAALKHQYGTDRPWPERYVRWLLSLGGGQFGYSTSYHQTVGSLLWTRARNTILLSTMSIFIAWTVALLWGVWQARSRGFWSGSSGLFITAAFLAVPDAMLALLLLVLAARSGWFPTAGMNSSEFSEMAFAVRFADVAKHLVLPVTALALSLIPTLAGHVRSAMSSVLDSTFIAAARGHGIPEWRVLLRHALPVAMNPLIGLFGFSIGTLLSMSVIVEVVFSWPGLGPLALEAILSRDVYVVMAIVMLSSVLLILGNLLADIWLYWNDPRVRTV